MRESREVDHHVDNFLWFSQHSCEEKNLYCSVHGKIAKNWNGRQNYWNAGSGSIQFELRQKGTPVNFRFFAISDTEFSIKSSLNNKKYTGVMSGAGGVYAISYNENLIGKRDVTIEIMCSKNDSCANIYTMNVLYDTRIRDTYSSLTAGLTLVAILMLFAVVLAIFGKSADSQ